MSAPKGGSLGRSLASILADTTLKTRAAAQPAEHAARDRFVTSLMERWEHELAPTAQAIVGEALADPNTPDDVKAMLGELVAPSNQTTFLLQLLTLPFALFALCGAVQAANVDYFTTWSRERRPVLPLTPAELALAVLKGELDEGQAAGEAKKSGIDNERFAKIIGITGEPPGLQQLLEAFRRGYIDEGRLDHGIRQSRVRNEWIDVMHALRFAPVGPGEVLAGAVQNHLSPDDARRRLGEAGVDPENFGWLYETHGRPPGVQELIELWNRGDATQGDVEQAIRESDIKNRYIPLILKMRRRLMPERTVVSGVGKGVLTRDQGLDHLLKLGFNVEDATALVDEAHHDKTQRHRDLAEGQVVAGYIDRFVTRPDAHAVLVTLGYDDHEADFLLDLADHQRERRFTEAAVNRVHSRYVGHHIDKAKAGGTLDALNVTANQRDDLLKLWDLERDANIPQLTVAQLEGALRRGLIDEGEFVARVEGLGYTEDDAWVLIGLSSPAPKTPKPPAGA